MMLQSPLEPSCSSSGARPREVFPAPLSPRKWACSRNSCRGTSRGLPSWAIAAHVQAVAFNRVERFAHLVDQIAPVVRGYVIWPSNEPAWTKTGRVRTSGTPKAITNGEWRNHGDERSAPMHSHRVRCELGSSNRAEYAPRRVQSVHRRAGAAAAGYREDERRRAR